MKLGTLIGLGLALLAGGTALGAQTPAAVESAKPRTAPPQQAQNQFSVTTMQIEVPVLVFDRKNQPIDLLSEDAFALTDNGSPQTLRRVDNEPRPVSVAIVVDVSDLDAIQQCKRSAQVIASEVIGAEGEAAVYAGGGPEPETVQTFTTDHNRLTWALQHLQPAPVAPQGEGQITRSINLAELALQKVPAGRTKAILVISHAEAKSGDFAESLMEYSETNPALIFHMVPNHCAGCPQATNPLSPALRGTGVGSQRDPRTVSPVGTGGAVLTDPNQSPAQLDLGPVLKKGASLVEDVVMPHYMNYVYDSGGMDFSPGDDHDYDATLNTLGMDLRSIYRLYYSPNNMTDKLTTHDIHVTVKPESDTQQIGHTTYRRTYFAASPNIH